MECLQYSSFALKECDGMCNQLHLHNVHFCDVQASALIWIIQQVKGQRPVSIDWIKFIQISDLGKKVNSDLTQCLSSKKISDENEGKPFEPLLTNQQCGVHKHVQICVMQIMLIIHVLTLYQKSEKLKAETFKFF